MSSFMGAFTHTAVTSCIFLGLVEWFRGRQCAAERHSPIEPCLEQVCLPTAQVDIRSFRKIRNQYDIPAACIQKILKGIDCPIKKQCKLLTETGTLHVNLSIKIP